MDFDEHAEHLAIDWSWAYVKHDPLTVEPVSSFSKFLVRYFTRLPQLEFYIMHAATVLGLKLCFSDTQTREKTGPNF
jgi:hypothetical protein